MCSNQKNGGGSKRNSLDRSINKSYLEQYVFISPFETQCVIETKLLVYRIILFIS
jgi:hypothetical protein